MRPWSEESYTSPIIPQVLLDVAAHAGIGVDEASGSFCSVTQSTIVELFGVLSDQMIAKPRSCSTSSLVSDGVSAGLLWQVR